MRLPNPPASGRAGAAGMKTPKYKPVEPVTLVFRDLSYSVRTGHGTKQLLREVSAYARPGTATAIMGPTGTLHGCVPRVTFMTHWQQAAVVLLQVRGKRHSWICCQAGKPVVT